MRLVWKKPSGSLQVEERQERFSILMRSSTLILLGGLPVAFEAVLYWVEHLSLAYRAVNLIHFIFRYQYSLKTLHSGKSFWEKVPYLGVLDFFFLFLKKGSILNIFFSASSKQYLAGGGGNLSYMPMTKQLVSRGGLVW